MGGEDEVISGLPDGEKKKRHIDKTKNKNAVKIRNGLSYSLWRPLVGKKILHPLKEGIPESKR